MSAVPSKSDLSLSELLHVLDVARTLRRDSEIVDSELNQEQLLASLKERLLAAAAAAGDQVTEAEVDAAIRIYFDNLHTYTDPPRSLQTLLAHLYILRTLVAASAALCLACLVAAWWLFWSQAAPLSSAARDQRAAAARDQAADAAMRDLTTRLAAVRSLAEDPAALEQLTRLEREAAPALATRNTPTLTRLMLEVAALEAQLREEYQVLIVTGADRRSGVDRGYNDKSAGWYLLVEAVTPDGRVLPREITDRETGRPRRVTTWGEQVPQPVYDRIAQDKAADGAVDERLFAVKRPGWLREEVRLPGENGQPLPPGGRITSW